MSHRNAFAIAFLLAATLPLHSAPAEPDSWSRSYLLEAKKDYVQAALVIAPQCEGNEFAQLRWAYLNYMQGNFEVSLKGYQRALEMNAQSLDALLGMTLPLMAQKRWSEAANKAQRVLELAPWNYTAMIRLIICEEAQGLWTAVATHGRELARHYPSDTTATLYWARGEAKVNHRAEALQAYQRLLQLYPGHQEALAFLKKNASSSNGAFP